MVSLPLLRAAARGDIIAFPPGVFQHPEQDTMGFRAGLTVKKREDIISEKSTVQAKETI